MHQIQPSILETPPPPSEDATVPEGCNTFIFFFLYFIEQSNKNKGENEFLNA